MSALRNWQASSPSASGGIPENFRHNIHLCAEYFVIHVESSKKPARKMAFLSVENGFPLVYHRVAHFHFSYTLPGPPGQPDRRKEDAPLETKLLAQFVAETPFEALDGKTLGLAKMCILDFCGAALAGSREESSRLLREVLLAGAGPGEAVLLDGSFRTLDPDTAAALNGGFGHAQDFDDLHNSSIVHPGVIVIPAALALGQQLRLSGRQVLLAVVLGYDVAARIGEAVNPEAYHYWHTTAVAAPFASAAVASKLFGLDAAATASAFGSAGTQAGGLWAFLAQGAMSKSLHVANGNLCGIRSARLAKAGFTGSDEIIESPRGFARALSPSPHLELVTRDLGNPFKIRTNSFKPYACCRHTHSACYGVRTMAERYGIRPGEVEAIDDYTYSTALNLTDNPDPANSYAAKFSLQYCIAASLLFPNLQEGAFSREKLEDPEVRALMGRVRVHLSPEIEADHEADANRWSHLLRCRMKDGRVFEDRFDYPFGDFNNPFSWEDAEGKFLQLAAPAAGTDRAEALARRIGKLEEMEDLRELFAF